MDRRRIKTKTPGVYYRLREDESRQYLIWFTGTDGKPHWKNTEGGEKEAKQERAKIINAMAHGHKVAPSRIMFADYIRGWLEEQHNAPKTLASYRSSIEHHLIPRLGRVKLSEVDVSLVARFIAGMQKDGYAANSIRITMKPLSKSLHVAARRGLIPVNPVTQLERSERPRGDTRRAVVLDPDEIELMLGASEKHKTLLATAVFTGVRMGELLALRWEDVNWAAGTVHVAGTKTKASVRDVVLMPALQQRLASMFIDTGLMFPVGRTTVRVALTQALAGAGIEKKIRVHDLRHTYASLLISQGHDLNYIASQMGHSVQMLLQTYAHLIDQDRKADVVRERLESSFGQVVGK